MLSKVFSTYSDYSAAIIDVIVRIKKRDIRMLIGFALISALIIALGEWGAFSYNMVDRYGIAPVLLRAFLYILISSFVWAVLLSSNRSHIARLMHRNELYFYGLLEAYEGALELRDPYTGGHGRRVAEYTAVICRILNISEHETKKFTHAALLHDIGKIGVPDHILNKPSALSEEEFDYIRRHPSNGADLIVGIEGLQPLDPPVRYHHERYSGSGYPFGLKGEDIPFGARIIAIADTLDAVTSARSYRSAASFDYAFEEILRGRKTLYDPLIIEKLSSQNSKEALRKVYEDSGEK